MCLLILASSFYKIPSTFILIIKSAFTPTSAFGGFVGASVSMAIRNTMARCVFSNELGLGSAPVIIFTQIYKHS